MTALSWMPRLPEPRLPSVPPEQPQYTPSERKDFPTPYRAPQQEKAWTRNVTEGSRSRTTRAAAKKTESVVGDRAEFSYREKRYKKPHTGIKAARLAASGQWSDDPRAQEWIEKLSRK